MPVFSNKDQLYNGGTFTKEDKKLTTVFASFAGIAFDKKSMNRVEGGDGQTLAILLSNMMTAEESNSCQPPYQVVFPQEKLKHYRSNRFDVSQLKLSMVSSSSFRSSLILVSPPLSRSTMRS